MGGLGLVANSVVNNYKTAAIDHSGTVFKRRKS